MKKKIVILLYFCLYQYFNLLKAQNYTAEVHHIQGIVMTRYARCVTNGYEDVTWYTERESRLLVHNKEYPFIRFKNGLLLRKYPELLKKIGGELWEYDDDGFFLDKKRITENADLRFCKYDSIMVADSGIIHINNGNKGYYSDGIDLFAVYHFEGEVVLYTGYWPFYRSEETEDCGCPDENEPPLEEIQFAILKKINCVNEISFDQQSQLKINSVGIYHFLYQRCQ